MRKVLIAPLLLLGTLLLCADEPFACGDKFLVTGRGIRSEHLIIAPHPASILIYRNPDSAAVTSVTGEALLKPLTRAGHTYQVATSRAEFEAALESGKFDIVLADLQDAPRIEKGVGAASTKPAILPVIGSGIEVDKDSLKKQYACYVQAPSRSTQLLAAVNKVMKARRVS